MTGSFRLLLVNNIWKIRGRNKKIAFGDLQDKLHWYTDGPATLNQQNIWLEHNSSQDHFLPDLDGPAHFLLVMHHRTIGYFNPWKLIQF